MKIGVSSYSFSAYRTNTGAGYLDICELAKRIGYEAIEFTGLYIADDTTREEKITLAKQIKEKCDSLGLKIPAYTVGANLIGSDAEKVVDELIFCLDIAKILGAGTMRHDVTFGLPEGWTYKDAIREATPRIRRIADEGAKRGIITCIENHGTIFQAPERVEELILAVDRPNFGWLCDIGNFLCADCEPSKSVSIAAKYACHVHAKDFLYRSEDDPAHSGFNIKTAGGNYLRGTVVGHGIVPVRECLDLLKKSGYDGYVSVEFEGAEEPLYALENGYKNLRLILESLG